MTINEKGIVEDIRAEGDDETFNQTAIEAAAKTTKNIKWKPAMENGKAVSDHMKLPIAMNLH